MLSSLLIENSEELLVMLCGLVYTSGKYSALAAMEEMVTAGSGTWSLIVSLLVSSRTYFHCLHM